MPEVLLAADAEWVRNDVLAVLTEPGVTVRQVTAGVEVLPAVIEHQPDLVVLDLQIGNMGGMAACMELRLEEGVDRLPHIPVLMLLDRRATCSSPSGRVPMGGSSSRSTRFAYRRAVDALLAGGRYEDDTFKPADVNA